MQRQNFLYVGITFQNANFNIQMISIHLYCYCHFFSKEWSETNDVLRTIMVTKKNKKVLYEIFVIS